MGSCDSKSIETEIDSLNISRIYPIPGMYIEMTPTDLTLLFIHNSLSDDAHWNVSGFPTHYKLRIISKYQSRGLLCTKMNRGKASASTGVHKNLSFEKCVLHNEISVLLRTTTLAWSVCRLGVYLTRKIISLPSCFRRSNVLRCASVWRIFPKSFVPMVGNKEYRIGFLSGTFEGVFF
jgi:hypothetical protein